MNKVFLRKSTIQTIKEVADVGVFPLVGIEVLTAYENPPKSKEIG